MWESGFKRGSTFFMERKSAGGCLYGSELKKCFDYFLGKPQDLLIIRKFVRKMKGSKHKIVNGQNFEKAANLEPYLRFLQF